MPVLQRLDIWKNIIIVKILFIWLKEHTVNFKMKLKIKIKNNNFDYSYKRQISMHTHCAKITQITQISLILHSTLNFWIRFYTNYEKKRRYTIWSCHQATLRLSESNLIFKKERKVSLNLFMSWNVCHFIMYHSLHYCISIFSVNLLSAFLRPSGYQDYIFFYIFTWV